MRSTCKVFLAMALMTAGLVVAAPAAQATTCFSGGGASVPTASGVNILGHASWSQNCATNFESKLQIKLCTPICDYNNWATSQQNYSTGSHTATPARQVHCGTNRYRTVLNETDGGTNWTNVSTSSTDEFAGNVGFCTG